MVARPRQIQRTLVERNIAQADGNGMRPCPPSILGKWIAGARFAYAELLRELEMLRRLLREQRERIEPDDGFGQKPLAYAGFGLALLERHLKPCLRFGPASFLHVH